MMGVVQCFACVAAQELKLTTLYCDPYLLIEISHLYQLKESLVKIRALLNLTLLSGVLFCSTNAMAAAKTDIVEARITTSAGTRKFLAPCATFSQQRQSYSQETLRSKELS